MTEVAEIEPLSGAPQTTTPEIILRRNYRVKGLEKSTQDYTNKLVEDLVTRFGFTIEIPSLPGLTNNPESYEGSERFYDKSKKTPTSVRIFHCARQENIEKLIEGDLQVYLRANGDGHLYGALLEKIDRFLVEEKGLERDKKNK